ncbi:Zinc/iron permease [Neoconidiobolus thromboides FSU 785]|nr:Zinc/iron permease [Neoconidiobolus thromboides FSU 785]
MEFKKIYLWAILLLIAILGVDAHGHHHHHHHHDHFHAGIHKDHAHGHSHTHHHDSKFESKVNYILDLLFPSQSPMFNSFLSTFYISFFPNILLLFVPSQIRASSLNVLVSFAVGGLLGDVFLHLLPHTFMDAFSAGLNPEELTIRNICIGLAIFAGALSFYFLDKLLRIVSGNKGHSHSHGHSHNHTHSHKGEKDSATSTGLDSKEESGSSLRKRKEEKNNKDDSDKQDNKEIKQVKLSAYLNLIADFSHNFTDGLAIAASFYFSRSIGISTTIAVFFHEIPHEVGDFAILLQSGFSRLEALYSQFITAIGAMLGTAAGVAIQELLNNQEQVDNNEISKLFGYLPISASDLVLPITAGGFLYIATVSVIPDLLETPNDLENEKKETSKLALGVQLFKEVLAMLLGVALMALVSLYE